MDKHTKPPEFRSMAVITSAIQDLLALRKETAPSTPAYVAVDAAIDTLMWVTDQHNPECCKAHCPPHCTVPPMKDGSTGCHNGVRLMLHHAAHLRNARKIESLFNAPCGDKNAK